MPQAQIPTSSPVPAPLATPPHRCLIPANYREAFTASQIAAADAALDLLITVAIRADRAEQAEAAQQ